MHARAANSAPTGELSARGDVLRRRNESRRANFETALLAASTPKAGTSTGLARRRYVTCTSEGEPGLSTHAQIRANAGLPPRRRGLWLLGAVVGLGLTAVALRATGC